MTRKRSAAKGSLIYARKSTKVEFKRSLDEQDTACTTLSERLGLPVEERIYEEASAYAEKERPAFSRALKIAAERNLVILTWTIDRFSRQGADDVLPLLKRDAPLRLVTVDGKDTADPKHRRMIINTAEDDREYSEKISANVRRAKAEDRANGTWLGGRAPYGLQLVTEWSPDRRRRVSARLVLDPVTAPVVRRIVGEVLGGASLLSIARKLNEEEIPGPAGGDWRASPIGRLLRNPALCGWLPASRNSERQLTQEPARDDKGDPIVCGEALITPAERRAILAQLEGRARPSGQANGRTSKALLKGRARCGRCNGAMTPAGSSYRCATRSQGGTCEGNTVEVASADGYVTHVVLTALEGIAAQPWDLSLSDRALLAAVSEHWVAEEHADVAVERRELEAEVADVRAVLADLEDARYRPNSWEFKGEEGQERYERLYRRNTAALETAQARLAALGAPAVTLEETIEGLRLGEAKLLAPDEQRRLVRLALKEVVVRAAVQGSHPNPNQRLRVELVDGSHPFAAWPIDTASERPALRLVNNGSAGS